MEFAIVSADGTEKEFVDAENLNAAVQYFRDTRQGLTLVDSMDEEVNEAELTHTVDSVNYEHFDIFEMPF